MPKHVMVDLETWGTSPGCAIRSIGAVVFDPHSEFVGEHFYCNVDRHSCEIMGLDFDPATIEWWANQSQDARDALDVNPHDVRHALKSFADWFKDRVWASHIWCNGANFDEPILVNLLKRFSIPVPWKYWAVRDTRTIWDAGGIDPRRVIRDGTAHNALADARHQARCVQMAYQTLRTGKVYADVLPLNAKPREAYVPPNPDRGPELPPAA